MMLDAAYTCYIGSGQAGVKPYAHIAADSDSSSCGRIKFRQLYVRPISSNYGETFWSKKDSVGKNMSWRIT